MMDSNPRTGWSMSDILYGQEQQTYCNILSPLNAVT